MVVIPVPKRPQVTPGRGGSAQSRRPGLAPPLPSSTALLHSPLAPDALQPRADLWSSFRTRNDHKSALGGGESRGSGGGCAGSGSWMDVRGRAGARATRGWAGAARWAERSDSHPAFLSSPLHSPSPRPRPRPRCPLRCRGLTYGRHPGPEATTSQPSAAESRGAAEGVRGIGQVDGRASAAGRGGRGAGAGAVLSRGGAGRARGRCSGAVLSRGGAGRLLRRRGHRRG